MTATGTCPKCHGTKRRPVPEGYDRRWLKPGRHWDEATDTFPCDNCGAQTMSMTATGQVRLRPDGTPCLHEYHGKTTRNCYHEYDCKHCGDHYAIDSGD